MAQNLGDQCPRNRRTTILRGKAFMKISTASKQNTVIAPCLLDTAAAQTKEDICPGGMGALPRAWADGIDANFRGRTKGPLAPAGRGMGSNRATSHDVTPSILEFTGLSLNNQGLGFLADASVLGGRSAR